MHFGQYCLSLYFNKLVLRKITKHRLWNHLFENKLKRILGFKFLVRDALFVDVG